MKRGEMHAIKCLTSCNVNSYNTSCKQHNAKAVEKLVEFVNGVASKTQMQMPPEVTEFLQKAIQLQSSVVPEDAKEVLPLTMVNQIKEEIKPKVLCAEALKNGLSWFEKAKNSKANPASDDIKDFLEFMGSGVDWAADHLRCQLNTVLAFTNTYAKNYLRESVISFGGFIVQLCDGRKPAAKVMEAEAAKVGEDGDWQNIARLSTVVLRRFVPTMTFGAKQLEILDKKVEIHYVCLASRFYEVRLLSAAADLVIKDNQEDAKVALTAMHQHLDALGPIFATTKHMLASYEDGAVKKRLHSIMAHVQGHTILQIRKFSEKIIAAFDKVKHSIVKQGSDTAFTNFIQKTGADTLDEHRNTLLEVCDSKPATELMKFFNTVEVWQKSVKTMQADFEPITTAFQEEDVTAAVEKACTDVGEAEKEFGSESEETGTILGHMCILQSLYRKLEPGETRAALVGKCKKSFTKKVYLKAEPHMKIMLEQMAGGES